MDKPNFPRAILEWPNGLSQPPTIKPLGGSVEQDQEIFDLLSRVFKEIGNG